MTALLLAALMGPACLGEAAPEATVAPEATFAPEATVAPEAAPTEEAEAPQVATAYVLVSTPAQVGWLPLPLEGESTYPLAQTLPDGTETLNLIHLTPEGVYMEDSTCDNHDCVDQGIVTLENREERILGNMIICLPNQVYLQLFTREEMLALMGGQEDAEP